MEIENNLNQRISKTIVFFCFGFALLFLVIPFLFYPWSPSFVGSYFSPTQLFHNGLIATAVLSLYMMISVSIVLIVNFIVRSNKSLSILQIIGWTLATGMIAIAISVLSTATLANLIKIPGGIKINFSDLEPLGFMITTSFYSAILTLVILVSSKILNSKKYAILLLVISVILVSIGVWKINQNAVGMESQYVLEQCQTLAYGVVIESGLTPIGQELSGLGIKADKSKMDKIVADYGPRCKLQSSEAFALVRENFLALSLSRKANFETDYQTERSNFIDWVNKNVR